MERSEELERLVADWFASASRGDRSLVDAHVSDDPGTRLIGSDPDEILDGGAAVRAFLAGEVASAGGRAAFAPADVAAYSEGTVGWATANLRITLPDGRYVTPRWSAVLRREEGVWRFVQTHASIGVPNDAVGWVYPT